MIRTTSIAALVTVGFALPALAADTSGNANAAHTSVHAQELKNQYDAKQAHNILASRGFVNISALDRDDDGRWTGIATKDGKTIFVAVALPPVQAVTATN
jgi:hypothetical protein